MSRALGPWNPGGQTLARGKASPTRGLGQKHYEDKSTLEVCCSEPKNRIIARLLVVLCRRNGWLDHDEEAVRSCKAEGHLVRSGGSLAIRMESTSVTLFAHNVRISQTSAQ